MKTIKLKKISLYNWKGQTKEINFMSDHTLIKGKNGSGKTSLANAWYWVFTGYTDINSVPNNELFDNTQPITKDTPLAKVEICFSINDQTYTIAKTAEAKFTRERGSNEYVKAKSDVYTYYLDNIEISVSDFKQWVEKNICPMDALKYCLNGQFFSTLCYEDKNKARKVLEQMFGDVEVKDIPLKYPNIYDKINTLSIDSIENQTKNAISPLKERMKVLPKLIEEKHNLINSFTYPFDEIEKEVDVLKSKISEIDNQILDNSKIYEEYNAKLQNWSKILAEHNNTLNAIKREYTTERNNAESVLLIEKQKIEYENKDVATYNSLIESNIQKYDKLISNLVTEIQYNERILEQLRKDKNEIKSLVFNDDKCPVCGQLLPADILDKKREDFNVRNGERLKQIIEKGKKTRQEVDDSKSKLEELKAERELYISNNPKKEGVSQYIQDINKQIEEFNNSYQPLESYPKYIEQIKIINAWNQAKPEQDINATQIVEKLKSSKSMYMNTLLEKTKQLGLKSQIEVFKQQITSMEEEMSSVGLQIAKLEKILDECKNYVQEKANLISEVVNSKLSDCKIQMWNRQKDGSIIADCVITNNYNVKYSTMNNADRIKTSISLQKMFDNYYDIEMPVIIDEYSIFDSNNAPKLDCCYVALMASDDYTLNVQPIL
ncbi:MAG: ATP-binding protein [Anaeroplasma sp.]